MEKMSVNGKNYEILKLLGHGKGGAPIIKAWAKPSGDGCTA